MCKVILFFILTFTGNQSYATATNIADKKLDIVQDENYNSGNNDDDIFSSKENEVASNSTDNAKLILINKMTAKAHLITFKVKQKQIFENLEIEVRKCLHNKRKFHIDDKVYLEISEQKIYDDNKKIFEGWLYSKSPSLNTLEHPVYEVLLDECI